MRTLVIAIPLLLLPMAGCLDDLRGAFGDPVEPRDYLTDDKYGEWLIELDYTAGHRPDSSVTDLLRTRISPLVHKPDGVIIKVGDSLPATNQAWTTEALVKLSKAHKDQISGDGRVTTHLLFVDGHSDADKDNQKVLGVAIGFDLVVIFSGTIKESCSLTRIPPCTVTSNELMGAVTVHEFGHALGLVNRQASDGSTPVPDESGREDPEHPGHSSNRNSVMYWAVESSSIINLIPGDGLPTRFDADDKADLCNAGGKC